MKKFLVLVLAQSFLFVSCNTTDQFLTRVEPMAALAGIGYLADNKWEHALIAAGVGLAYGEYIAQKKANYATEEEKLNLDIEEIQNATKQLVQSNAETKKLNDQLEEDIAELSSNYRGLRQEREQLEEKRDILQSIQEITKKDIATVEEMLSYYTELSETNKDQYPEKVEQIIDEMRMLYIEKEAMERELLRLETHLAAIERTLR